MFASHKELKVGYKNEAKDMLAWHVKGETCRFAMTSTFKAIYGAGTQWFENRA